jgi:hypothetical protein
MLQKHSSRVMLHLKAAARCYQSRRAISITGFLIRFKRWRLILFTLLVPCLQGMDLSPGSGGLDGHWRLDGLDEFDRRNKRLLTRVTVTAVPLPHARLDMS